MSRSFVDCCVHWQLRDSLLPLGLWNLADSVGRRHWYAGVIFGFSIGET